MTTTRMPSSAAIAIDLVLQGRQHGDAQGVERIGTIERERDDAAFIAIVAQQGLGEGTRFVFHGFSWSIAAAERAFSRSWNFWILPVDVLGIASKRISRGTL